MQKSNKSETIKNGTNNNETNKNSNIQSVSINLPNQQQRQK
jgi:hypothetical protein